MGILWRWKLTVGGKMKNGLGIQFYTLGLLAMLLSPIVARAHHDRIDSEKAVQLVNLLYEGVLFREPDPQGLSYWTRLITTYGYDGLLRSAGAIGGSDEFVTRTLPMYGARAIIENMYWVFFYREMDPAAEGWVTLLAQGRTREVVRGIVGSPEFRQLHIDSFITPFP